MFKIDDHVGISIAGLTADARLLCKYMRNECLNHKFSFEEPIQVGRLVTAVSDKSQIHTQNYGRRPYGVGLLVIGYDKTGTHLYETSPSGNFYDYKAIAIGGRSQSAKTYLEKFFESFNNLSLDELIKHSLLALRETVQTSATSEGLNAKNCSVGIVGENQQFEILEGAKLQTYLESIEGSSKDTKVTSSTTAMEH